MVEQVVEHMLSTKDNPYNPWLEPERWEEWDVSHGYFTLPLLGRVVVTSNDLSDVDVSLATEQAIEEIVEENVSGMHCKVPQPDVMPARAR